MKLSIIVPTKNSSQHITETCESILEQQYDDYEVLFIDAESIDGTLEFIASYKNFHARTQSVPKEVTLYEMVNRGIKMAQYDYILVFFPGTTFLFVDALKTLRERIDELGSPDIFYTASFVQDDMKKSSFFFRPCEEKYLKFGQQPAAIEATLIRKALFQRIGYFDAAFRRRAPLEFFIRACKEGSVRIASEMRVYVELQPLLMNVEFLLENMKESCSIIRKHFGALQSLLYFSKQRDMKRLLRRMRRRIVLAFQRR